MNDSGPPMKSEPSNVCSGSVSAGNDGDSSKLMSLLALATGALAMPQTSNADVVFVDLSTNNATVSAGGNTSFVITNLPGLPTGGAQLGFQAHTKMTNITSSRWITAGQKQGYVRVKSASSFVIPVGPGLTWNQVVSDGHMHAAVKTVYGFVAAANYFGHAPNSFNEMYFPFIFKDNSLPGSPLRYGWIELNLSNPTSGNGPDIQLLGYAYQTDGTPIATGAVPEPAPIALLALGALTLGAKGLRSWRRDRPATI